MGDVQGMIGTWQGSAPMAYVSTGAAPDQGHLADWMQKMLDTSGGLLMFKARSADPLWDGVTGWLAGQGVDVEAELARVGREHEYRANRAREAADRAEGVAIALKKAERDLLAESRGYMQNARGFTRATLAEAQGRVNDLADALDEACHHDEDLARRVRRQVA